MLKVRFE